MKRFGARDVTLDSFGWDFFQIRCRDMHEFAFKLRQSSKVGPYIFHVRLSTNPTVSHAEKQRYKVDFQYLGIYSFSTYIYACVEGGRTIDLQTKWRRHGDEFSTCFKLLFVLKTKNIFLLDSGFCYRVLEYT